MKIAYITAGAAGMLCGSCLHDNALAAALKRQGHDVALVPCYTPLRTDETPVAVPRVFYGALSVWLEGKYPFFRSRRAWLERLLDHPALLRWISRRDWTTSPAELGSMALSVLKGEDGAQRKELEKLAAWLRDDFRPDVVHLTNSMFLGMAGPLARATGAPVVCSVQGEDLFLDGMMEPYRSETIAAMRDHARDVAGFVAPCRDHAARMGEILGIPEDRMRLVPLGISLHGYAERQDGSGPHGASASSAPFTVGYLARVCPEKGFHLLAEGFRTLVRRVGNDAVRMRAAGHLRPRDKSYLDDTRKKLDGWGLASRWEYLGEVDRAGKLEFLRSVDVLCVPTVYRESKGLFVLEALASGVPVALPRHGSFPEMVEGTGGGVLFEPGSPDKIAEALEKLMRDPASRRAMGERGRQAVRARYSDEAMARNTLAVYREVIPARAARTATS